jgi:hypothetical protein
MKMDEGGRGRALRLLIGPALAALAIVSAFIGGNPIVLAFTAFCFGGACALAYYAWYLEVKLLELGTHRAACFDEDASTRA